MKKLVAVEYSPVILKKSRKGLTPIANTIGETFESYLERPALEVPVRFPLNAPGSFRRHLTEDRDSLSEIQLLQESVLVEPRYLHKVKKTPISLYEKIKVSDFSELFEKPVYMPVYSLKKLREEIIPRLEAEYSHRWAWLKEWSSDVAPTLFMEARIYGADNVVNTYARNKFSGVALQVIVRPTPNKEHLEQGIRSLRSVCDVFVYSNTTEFISYLDGVKIPKIEIGEGAVLKRYKNYVFSAKEILEEMRNPKEQKKLLKKKSNNLNKLEKLEEMEKKVVKWMSISSTTSY